MRTLSSTRENSVDKFLAECAIGRQGLVGVIEVCVCEGASCPRLPVCSLPTPRATSEYYKLKSLLHPSFLPPSHTVSSHVQSQRSQPAVTKTSKIMRRNNQFISETVSLRCPPHTGSQLGVPALVQTSPALLCLPVSAAASVLLCWATLGAGAHNSS